MVSRAIVRRLASQARAAVAKRKEGRSDVGFVDDIKSRLSPRLDTLNERLSEADRSRAISKSDISDVLSKRILSEECRFVQVGSSVNGLCSDNSDIDLVFFPKSRDRRRSFLKDFHGNADFKVEFLNVVTNLVSREMTNIGDPVEGTVVLHQLRIPLLIVQLQSGRSIDIQFPDEQFQAIRNTNLIRHYVQCDSRLSQLFLYLRALFDALEIRESKYGLLSSYHILLLAIHFLQSEQAISPWPVLPVLCTTHSHLVGAHVSIDDIVKALDSPYRPIEWTSNNKMTTAELIVRFVDYYSTFDASQHAIYIEKGLATRRKQVSGDVHLLLLDPYSRVTVCRSSVAARAFADSMQYLRRRMVKGEFLDSFPTFPEAISFRAQTKWASWRDHVREKKAFIDKRNAEQLPQQP